MSRVLVTGATGFIGRHFLEAARHHELVAAVRDARVSLPPSVASAVVGPIGGGTPWAEALTGVETIVHLAARVHVMQDSAADPLAAFRAMNVEGTARLAEEARRAGVRRFVFVSSIKVNGEATHSVPFRESDPPAPADAYGHSKHEAEMVLRAMEVSGSLEVTIVRPPLVLGTGVRGNLLSLLGWIARGLPLPLSRVQNQRSLVEVTSLADLLLRCVESPAAAGQLYLAADAPPISTPAMIRELAQGMGVAERLLPVPEWALRAAGRATGRRAAVERLLGSLVVDSSKAQRELGWGPGRPIQEGLRALGAWYGRVRQQGKSR